MGLGRYTCHTVKNFCSDNNAGLCPEAAQALIEANTGPAEAYGDDAWSEKAVAAFREIFGPETSVWFVATGTAANTLAIAAMTRPWQHVLCYDHSHFNVDESTAPERITNCRVLSIPSETSKLTAADIVRHGRHIRRDVHEPQPGVVTVSNVTEFGEVYTPDDLSALCLAAHDLGYRVHVDGARFANAVAALGCAPRAITVDAGVDAMSFGGTKNGLAFGEAILFFCQGDGSCHQQAVEALPYLRKSTGHLLSKHRFVSAPFAATLRDDIWLTHAEHANRMAKRLSDGLVSIGYRLCFPTEASGVFVDLSERVNAALIERGYVYLAFGDPDWRAYRFMCHFDTSEAQVDAFLAEARVLIGR